jgi:serine/threonine protein kinase
MEQVLQNDTDFAAYHVEALLGRGGMSEVYRASNPRLENTIVLKLLARELTEDRAFRERFVRESRLAASLNHPNVVPIFDAGEWEGLPYIAMRYVDGPDLKQLLEERGRLAPDYAISVVAQVAAALDCAHEKGLVHRDVKPGNILVDEKAGDGFLPHVYLADFGVAKHRQSHSGLTSKGHYVGTIDYVAPEQIEGRPLSAATDVYSLGCVLFECLTGKPPFDHDSDVAMIFAHLSEAPPAPSSQRPELPLALDAVIAKALAKQPEERYASCRELVAAARAALAGAASEQAFAVPLGQPTVAATPLALETVLADSGNGTGVAPAPPTQLAAEPQASAPPTELAAGPRTFVQPGAEEQTSEQPDTLRNRPAWRSRRRLVIAFVALLIAAGAAAAAPTLTGSSGKKTPAGKHNSNSNGGQSGSALNPNLSSNKHHSNGASGSTTTKQTKTSTALAQRRKTSSAKTGSGSTSKTLSSRRSSNSSSSSSGSTSKTINSRRSSSSSGSSSSSSGSTSSTLSGRRSSSSSGSSSSSSGSTSSTLSSRRKK